MIITWSKGKKRSRDWLFQSTHFLLSILKNTKVISDCIPFLMLPLSLNAITPTFCSSNSPYPLESRTLITSFLASFYFLVSFLICLLIFLVNIFEYNYNRLFKSPCLLIWTFGSHKGQFSLAVIFIHVNHIILFLYMCDNIRLFIIIIHKSRTCE